MFKGSLLFNDSLRIDGNFDGEIESDGTLFVGKTGVLKAEVKVGNIIVEGKIEGNVTCKDKIELRATAKIFGDIQAARLTIAEGVNIVGKCSVSTENISSDSTKKDKPMPRTDNKRKDDMDAKKKDEKSEEKVGASI
jgi:cytoskeletal protein CcmA (bactofilin family)